ncbi:ABC transporter substrate-binding protein [Candidatus Bathyarchaeota archaeon]|nr:ABC transporter substrate-binding protein [Candidatus Bathyarchaeota archaeon]
MNSTAISKIQAIALIAIIVIAALAGVVYVFWSGDAQLADTIKIGVAANLDTTTGDDVWQGAVLAAEQINAEGGILERNVEVVGVDTNEDEGDLGKVSAALAKLITYHKVDYITGYMGPGGTRIMEDLAAEHKIIFLSTGSIDDFHTEQVAEDYEKYKYFFRTTANETTGFQSLFDSVLTLREYTGFNKLGYLISATLVDQMRANFDHLVNVEGFDLVYEGAYVGDEVDYSSFFAAAEAAGVEMLVSFFAGNDFAVIKEWYNRQSPLVIWGVSLLSQSSKFWAMTEGKCEHQSVFVFPTSVGYPVTSKTMPFREAYIDRWGEPPTIGATATYDTLRYILPDAIERAGTIETEAVIKALEETEIETTENPRCAFTSNHDMLFKPEDMKGMMFQWQADGTRVPVYPKEIMDEAGATYTYPDWRGPWD